eukprot:jgi/Tetstr1/436481/TSEL_025309.t1
MTAAKEMRHWNPKAHIGDDGYVLADVKAARDAEGGEIELTVKGGITRISERGANARRPAQRGANARRLAQRGANARGPAQRGANARRPAQRGANARRPAHVGDSCNPAY